MESFNLFCLPAVMLVFGIDGMKKERESLTHAHLSSCARVSTDPGRGCLEECEGGSKKDI